MIHLFLRAPLVLPAACAAALTACTGSSQSTAQATTSPEAVASATAAPSGPVAEASPTSSASPAITVAYTDINGLFAQQAITDEATLGAFESTSGPFRPTDPISRGQYVKWLVTLNNIYCANDATKQFRLPESAETTFADVPSSNAYWKYVQALADAGFVVGVDATHFAPDRNVTRQEMVAIKFQADVGTKATPNPGDTTASLSNYIDKNQVNPLYVTAVLRDSAGSGTGNIPRIWGRTAYLHPTKPLTRAEAAISLAQMACGTAANAVAAQRQH